MGWFHSDGIARRTWRFPRLRVAAMLLAAHTTALVASGCCEDQAAAGCQRDSECRGSRLCVDGVCVAPLDVGTPDGGGGRDVGEALDANPTPDLGGDSAGDPGVVSFVFNNASEVPIYVSPVYQGEASLLGVTIRALESGEILALGSACNPDCGSCEPVPCEAPEDRVRQILPHDGVSFDWDGRYGTNARCETASGIIAGCFEPHRAEVGDRYQIDFCYAQGLDVARAMLPRRLTGDQLNNARLGPVTCLSREFVFGGLGPAVSTSIDVEVEEEGPHEWGYCGKAWTYERGMGVGSLLREPSGARQGGTTMLPVGSISERCLARGNMRSQVDHDARAVLVSGGSYIASTCAGFVMEEYGLVLDGLEPGAWTLRFHDFPGEEDFVVAACPECLVCEEVFPLGSACDGDCECEAAAVCTDSCEVYCLSSRDCPPDTRCETGQEPVSEVGRCVVQSEHECAVDANCPEGSACVDSGSFRRCEPDMDTRRLESASSPGRGFRCACDAECPGAQSCVQMPTNFTEGFCALRCRDGRDCPEGWACLGETSSGLEAICLPPS